MKIQKRLVLLTLLISLSLGLSACVMEVPGHLSTVDKTVVNPLDQALVGIGGQAALENLSSFVLEVSGTRWVASEGLTPHSPRMQGNMFDTTISFDIAGDNLRLDTQRIIYGTLRSRVTGWPLSITSPKRRVP